MNVELAAASKQGGRKSQEDDYLLYVVCPRSGTLSARSFQGAWHLTSSRYTSPNGKINIIGVFDGHASGARGDLISDALVSAFKHVGDQLTSDLFRDPSSFKKVIAANCFQIDKWLLATQKRNAKEAGSTGILGFYDADSNSFYTCNVGDSRIVFFETTKNGGVAKGTWRQSKDHKPSLQSEIDRIEEAGGTVRTSKAESKVPRVAGILALSRAFGDYHLKRPFNKAVGDWVTVEPDVLGPFHPNRNRTFYAAAGSDGIFDMMKSREVSNYIVKNSDKDLETICEEIVDICIKRWLKKGADNCTIAMMKIN